VPFDAKRIKLAMNEEAVKENTKSDNKSDCMPSTSKAASLIKVIETPEVRDSPESPFEDIVSESDEDVLHIDLDAVIPDD
jgi:hypothetical protein